MSGVGANLGALTARVNDPTTGLGQVDDGVVGVYLTPPPPRTSPLVAPIFAPNIPTSRGDGATASGTAPVQCAAASCTLQVYAAVDSNKPQPPSGQAAAQVGGVLVVTKVQMTANPPPEAFQGFAQTAPNAQGNNVVDIPTRRPLAATIRDRG